MAHGRNNGKKLMAVRIIAHAFEIVSLADPQTLHTTTQLRIHQMYLPACAASHRSPAMIRHSIATGEVRHEFREHTANTGPSHRSTS